MLLSVWQDRRPGPLPDPVGTIDDEQDVVVVGGGLTGLTTALLLARAGLSVCVVEARWVGAGTTGGSTAKVTLLQGTRLTSIDRRHPPVTTRAYVEANSEGQAWLARFCAEHEVDSQRRPAITYATTPRGLELARQEHEVARLAGLPVEWDERLPLPFATLGGVRLEDQLQVDPMDLLDALVAQARVHGVRLVEGVRVRRVTGSDPVSVETEAGTLRATTVVVATNMPIVDRGGFFGRMAPARSYGLAFRTPEPAVDGMYISADAPTRSLRDAPTSDGDLLLVGGNGHATGRAGSTAARLEDLRDWTRTFFPGTEETHAWSAQDFVPHHRLPFAGPLVPGSEHLLMAGGYSKWGFTNAVAASLALSSRILGGRMDWAEVFEPWHPHELRGALGTAQVNAAVGLHLAAGWARPVLHPGVGPAPGEGTGIVRWERPGKPSAVSQVGGVERRTSAVCTHLGGIVTWNDAEASWDCPLHGSRFAPDGEVLDAPATCGLRRR